MVKKIVLLGASGSIGQSTLEVLREQRDKFELVLASVHTNIIALQSIAYEFNVPNLIITNDLLSCNIGDFPANANVYYGESELIRVLNDLDYDLVINAISGSAGLRSTMEVINRGKTLALANKESLVMSGHLVKELQAKTKAKIIPVDSEHSAVFQAIGTHPQTEVSKIHLTASGGAFRDLPLKDFDQITVQQALKHPNWSMGAKVTLDSATMFNKALEVMEAHWLFDMPYDRIDAVIHPQSVIHSMVEFVDGSILAQLSIPDMKLPILYALSHPHRFPSQLVSTDLLNLPALTFFNIDRNRYPLFYLGIEVAKIGGIMPTVMNAANEAALKLFMQNKISFNMIYQVIEQAVSKVTNINHPGLDELIQTNKQVFDRTYNI